MLTTTTDVAAPSHRRPRPPRPAQKMLSPRQIESEYGIAYTSIRDLHFRLGLPVIKLGRRWWIYRTDLESFLSRFRETSPA